MFQWNRYPGVAVREALATELGISEACVQVRPYNQGFLFWKSRVSSVWKKIELRSASRRRDRNVVANYVFFFLRIM